MQQSSEVNISERFGRALGEVRSIIDEHEELCTERVREAEAAAQGDISRFGEASGELAQARRELSALEEEREGLPFMAFRANLDGDAEREEALRARYASIAPEHIEHLRGRIEALEREVASLGGTESGAAKRAYTNARDAYTEVLRALEAFEERIGEQKAAVGELRSKYWTGQRGVVEQLSFLRGIEQSARREARAEAAKREEARRAVTGTRGKVVG
ncbi:MAG: hypothetical protein M3Q49_20375 [Actinomycetota bacterium]|nr:hypothetical protein [Actinomycetota bacterium]